MKLKSPVKSHGSRYLSGQVSMLCFAIHVIMLKLVTQPRFKPLKPRVLDSSKSPFIDDCWFFFGLTDSQTDVGGQIQIDSV